MADAQDTSVGSREQLPTYLPDPAGHMNAVPAACVLVRATHHGEPQPKDRPRYTTKGGSVRAYTTKNTKAHQRALAAAAAPQLLGVPVSADWAFGIRAIFYVGTHQRKDTDNMMKAVLDAMNKLAFADDSQVKETMCWSIIDFASPRTEFIVYRMHPIDRDTGLCVQCGRAFRRYRSWKARRYCSRKCNLIAVTKSVVVHCAECGRELLRKPGQVEKNVKGKFYCSGACLGKHNRRVVACAWCGASINRPQSQTPAGKDVFYCRTKCRNAAQVGTKMNLSPESLSDRARRGWATRRAGVSPASGEGADRNGDAPRGANFDGDPPVAG